MYVFDAVAGGYTIASECVANRVLTQLADFLIEHDIDEERSPHWCSVRRYVIGRVVIGLLVTTHDQTYLLTRYYDVSEVIKEEKALVDAEKRRIQNGEHVG